MHWAKLKVTIVGDYASINKRIGTELASRDYQVEFFLQTNKYADLPADYFRLGSVQGPMINNYIRTGFWMVFGRIFKKSKIE